MWIYVFIGDWRTGTAAAEPPNSAGVYGPEAGTGHQAVPPHWEGQAGILSAVCYVADGEWTWLHTVLCIDLWKTLYFQSLTFPTLDILKNPEQHGHEVDEATFSNHWKKRTKKKSYIRSKTVQMLFREDIWGGLKDRRIKDTLMSQISVKAFINSSMFCKKRKAIIKDFLPNF